MRDRFFLGACLAGLELAAAVTAGCGELSSRGVGEPRVAGTQAQEDPRTPQEIPTAPLDSEPMVLAEPTLPEYALLPVQGHGEAVVSVPGTGRPAPVLVASHGAGGRPTWQCEVWGSIVGNRGFVVCPRGTRMGWTDGEGYFFRHHHALGREVLAVLEALRERYGRRVAPGPVVYVGFSQGATMGALMVVKYPHIFQRLVLVEGGEGEWDVPTAIRFREGGGERVLMVCGRHACAERARRSWLWLRKGGVEARVEHVLGAGHAYTEEMVGRLREHFEWVVQGDPRWFSR
ncbi:MAG TPA: hypothetical protein PKL73_18650 [Polyangiaceae bacterium]|nr:hypothetical protein [Polyangiaceae bacterium]HNZ25250.1 hypothetical protein [Polyangiaceae bacterium]HOD24835.1 hypothetical protein [Polyangiaceae bacterium]HOE51444.1 hypothetical protein [Polyangiaceae bacterium]HOH03345.1 hypothetical protein [Polyangiaceae bacterium]